MKTHAETRTSPETRRFLIIPLFPSRGRSVSHALFFLVLPPMCVCILTTKLFSLTWFYTSYIWSLMFFSVSCFSQSIYIT